jgi:hypothetical protein
MISQHKRESKLYLAPSVITVGRRMIPLLQRFLLLLLLLPLLLASRVLSSSLLSPLPIAFEEPAARPAPRTLFVTLTRTDASANPIALSGITFDIKLHVSNSNSDGIAIIVIIRSVSFQM